MIVRQTGREGRVEALRAEFDRGFSVEEDRDVGPEVDLLAFRLDADPYAVRLSEVGELVAGRRIVRLPSPVPELLGLAGLRGSVVPVYDLGAWLGYRAREAPRWFLVDGRLETAFGIDAFEGYAKVTGGALVPDHAAPRPFLLGQAVRLRGELRPLLDLASVHAAITVRARQHHSRQEA